MTITEIDIQLTGKEKFRDFLDTSVVGLIITLPIMLIVIVLLPLLFIFGLTWENIVEKYWYKLTGRQRKPKQPDFKDPYTELPIKVDFQLIWLIDGLIEKMKEKFKMTDKDFDELEIGQFTTNPPIADLKDRYFDWNTFAFDDKLFVQEVKLPDFKTSIGLIDCKDLKYSTIKDFDSYPLTTFTDKGDTLEITLRQPKMKKLIRIKNTVANKTYKQ